jgi:hypothetical protein
MGARDYRTPTGEELGKFIIVDIGVAGGAR